MNGRI